MKLRLLNNRDVMLFCSLLSYIWGFKLRINHPSIFHSCFFSLGLWPEASFIKYKDMTLKTARSQFLYIIHWKCAYYFSSLCILVKRTHLKLMLLHEQWNLIYSHMSSVQLTLNLNFCACWNMCKLWNDPCVTHLPLKQMHIRGNNECPRTTNPFCSLLLFSTAGLELLVMSLIQQCLWPKPLLKNPEGA